MASCENSRTHDENSAAPLANDSDVAQRVCKDSLHLSTNQGTKHSLLNRIKRQPMNQTLEIKLPPGRPMSMPSHEDLMQQHLRDEHLPEAVMPAPTTNNVLKEQQALLTGPNAGKIICMRSVHEVIPWAGHVNYAASKGGVMLMMKSIAQEVAPHRIRVNSVAPGAIRTPINMEAWGTPEAYRELMKLIPYKRIGEPDDIGRAAVWLASDDSDYIHGASIFVDGGMTLYPGFETGG